MNQKEIDNVIALQPIDRYRYFIKKIADWEEFFTLTDENGDYALSELDNHELFPVWSAKEFAELCKTDGWEKYNIKKLSLDDLEGEIIEFITTKNCLINVFPVHSNTGFVVSLKEFIRDLNDELDKIQ